MTSDGRVHGVDFLVAIAAIVLAACTIATARSATRIAGAIERIEKAGVVTVQTVHNHNTYTGLPGLVEEERDGK